MEIGFRLLDSVVSSGIHLSVQLPSLLILFSDLLLYILTEEIAALSWNFQQKSHDWGSLAPLGSNTYPCASRQVRVRECSAWPTGQPCSLPHLTPHTLALHTWTFCCSLNSPVCPSPRATALGPLCPPCPHSLLPTHILQPTLRDFRDHLSTLYPPACSISLHRFITTWCSAIYSCGIHVSYLSPPLETMRADTAALFSPQ